MMTVGQLARLSGVSVRTLHWYDHEGLLCPAQAAGSGARLYSPADRERLAQILTCRALGMGLKEIADYLSAAPEKQALLLEAHLLDLETARTRLDKSIGSVRETLERLKGAGSMTEEERFTALKEQALQENEARYGTEARERYGAEVVAQSRAQVAQMTGREYQTAAEEEQAMLAALKEAMRARDPEGAAAQETFRLHRAWLCRFWPKGMYTPEAHAALAETYVQDERFRAYYEERAGTGAAEMLQRIIQTACEGE